MQNKGTARRVQGETHSVAVRVVRMNTTELLSSIDAEIARLEEARALLAGQDGRIAKPARKKRSVMSAEARARIGAATKARWAAGKMSGRKRHSMSTEARARIAAGQRARWAKLKGAAKKAA